MEHRTCFPGGLQPKGKQGSGNEGRCKRLSYDWSDVFIGVSVDAEVTESAAEGAAEKKGWLKGVREGLSKSRKALGQQLASILLDRFDDEVWEKLEETLIYADGGVAATVKIVRVTQKLVPDGPHEVLLTLDATTGQNGLVQAKLFAESVDVSGVVLTKMDGTARGGIAIAVTQELGLPIKLMGVGEKVEDLRPFDPDGFSRVMFEEGVLGS